MCAKSTRKWGAAFGRATASRCVFTVKGPWEGEVRKLVGKLGLVEATTSGMRSHFTRSWALLDGYVIALDRFGLPIGTELASGTRVIGFRPFRLLVHLLGLVPPRKLKGESGVDPIDDLFAELDQQTALDVEERRQRAKRASGISERVQLQLLVMELFGADALPEPDGYLKGALPAQGEWRETGYSMLAGERLDAQGITPVQATPWALLGARAYDVPRFLKHDPSDVEPWLASDMPLGAAVRCIEAGLPLTKARQYLDAGFRASDVDSLFSAGLSPEDASAYLGLGLSSREVAVMARAGISLLDARNWTGAGFGAYDAINARDRGWTPEDVISWLAKRGRQPERDIVDQLPDIVEGNC